MPCLDSKVENERERNAYAAGLLCELMKVFTTPGLVPSEDLVMRLKDWYSEHVEGEA